MLSLQAKLNAEMSRTYKERLSIEVEKLRALFDVEVAKMQTFYMSSNVYSDETHVPFSVVSSDQNQNNHPLPNCVSYLQHQNIAKKYK